MEITQNVHLLPSAKNSHVYVVLGEEPILIDTGLPGHSAALLSDLAAIGIKPTDLAHILLTHHDVDHVGNAHTLQQATGAKLWAPKDDLPYIMGEKEPSGFKFFLRKLIKVDRPTIDATYEPGQKIGNIEMIPTPGHTPGHVSFLYGDTLFPGDLVASMGGKLKPAPGFLTWDKTTLQRSLSHVKNFSFDWVCTAHGDPIRRGNLWDALINKP